MKAKEGCGRGAGGEHPAAADASLATAEITPCRILKKSVDQKGGISARIAPGCFATPTLVNGKRYRKAID